MSSVIQRSTIIALGATNENVIAGQPGEFIGSRPAVVMVYAVRDTGGAAGVGTMEILFGQRQMYTPAPLSNSIADGRLITDQDLVMKDVARPGERITVRVTETGG
ncbi:unnamed protein product, partial [marine sediment metagenome]